MKKYLIEGLLIVFSVLFALFINKLAEDYKSKQKKQEVLGNIKQELYRNKAILEHWIPKHTQFNEQLDDILEGRNDSLLNLLKTDKYYDSERISKVILFDAILSQTSWETAKAIGIISEFDLNEIERLTLTYDMQKVVTHETIQKITELYFDPDYHKIDQLENTLIQSRATLTVLVMQERLLKSFYEETIKILE